MYGVWEQGEERQAKENPHREMRSLPNSSWKASDPSEGFLFTVKDIIKVVTMETGVKAERREERAD